MTDILKGIAASADTIILTIISLELSMVCIQLGRIWRTLRDRGK